MEAIISYQYHVAAPTVQSWQRWGHELELAKQQSSLEAKLSCPAGTMAVLQRAFSLQLNRHDGWDCPEQAAFGWAARYYKRGVKFSSYEGQSKVQFTQSYPNFADFDFVIVDSNVQPSGEQGHLRLETSETRKTLELVAVILARWRKMQRPKHWLIVGGGILLDVACFAAALSGAKTTLLPTTLTAMLDASVGGKTGVNFPPFGKNQVGAFHFSERVIINPTWLQTLPQRQLLAGAWEAVKHAIIAADIEMLNAWLTWSGDITALPDLQANLAVKIGIISTDAGETGLRRVLNFGHTLGHALEGVAHAQQTMILHGEAVACGIAFALLVSFELGERCDYAQSVYDALPIKGQRLRTLLGNLPAADLWQQVMHFVCHDKKSIDARRWILLANGKPSPIPQQVDAKTLYHCWQRLLAL